LNTGWFLWGGGAVMEAAMGEGGGRGTAMLHRPWVDPPSIAVHTFECSCDMVGGGKLRGWAACCLSAPAGNIDHTKNCQLSKLG
jgi:hypothetical protein